MYKPFNRFNSSLEVIRTAVLMYAREPHSQRNGEDLLAERGIDICHKTVRCFWNRDGELFAAQIKTRGLPLRHGGPEWQRHLDELCVKSNGRTDYVWRAVDHEGEVLEVVATKRRDRKAALTCLRQLTKQYDRPYRLVTNRLKFCGAAVKVIGNAHRHECKGRRNQQPRRNISSGASTT
jgi:putative transposase